MNVFFRKKRLLKKAATLLAECISSFEAIDSLTPWIGERKLREERVIKARKLIEEIETNKSFKFW